MINIQYIFHLESLETLKEEWKQQSDLKERGMFSEDTNRHLPQSNYWSCHVPVKIDRIRQ